MGVQQCTNTCGKSALPVASFRRFIGKVLITYN